MSLATSEPQSVKFLTRFDHVWASLRRYQLGQGLGWSFLAAALGLAALALADYQWELPWRVRAAGLVVATPSTLGGRLGTSASRRCGGGPSGAQPPRSRADFPSLGSASGPLSSTPGSRTSRSIPRV